MGMGGELFFSKFSKFLSHKRKIYLIVYLFILVYGKRYPKKVKPGGKGRGKWSSCLMSRELFCKMKVFWR